MIYAMNTNFYAKTNNFLAYCFGEVAKNNSKDKYRLVKVVNSNVNYNYGINLIGNIIDEVAYRIN